MKQFTLLSLFTALIFTSAIIISGCTKEGPQGPPGTDGTDGTAGCVKCHDDSQNIFAASTQWEASTHATGGNFNRNSASCGACHTSQGFLQRIANGTMEADGPVDNPAPVNCYACHQIHETYTEQDWALTASSPVEFWIDGDVFDMGKANLCAQCHQSRIPNPLPVPGGGDVEITYFRFGPHHGPQGNMFAGSGGYEVEGSLGYNSSLHTELVEDGCVTCHMADAYGDKAGGHTMKVAYSQYGSVNINEAGCVACHEGEDINEKVAETAADIEVLMAELRGLLLEQGVLDSSNYAIPGVMTSNQAGAILNYKMVLEDRSGGSHNFKYAKALLTNSIESIN